MADPFGDPNDPGASKRPAPTIEGTATEIVSEPAAGAAESEASEAANGTDHDDGLGDRAERAPEPPPRRMSADDLKGFFTHLAAGLLGGLIGVIALAFAWKLLPLGSSEKTEIAALQARVDKLQAAPAPAGDAKAIAGLDQRVKALEDRKVPPAPDLSDLTGRVTRLETTWDSLAKTADEGGSVADAAALDAKVGDMEQRLQANVASALDVQKTETRAEIQALQGELAALKAKLGALAEAKLGDQAEPGPELTALDQRIAKLEDAMPGLTSTVDRSAATAKSGALAIAFANLNEAVSAGRPYAAELAAVQPLLPDAADIGDLAAHAAAGIPTLPELAQQFADLADKAAPPPEAGGSFVDSVIASAKSAITIRRIDATATGNAPDAVMARAEDDLAQGELDDAVTEVDSLPPDVRDAFVGWLEKAHARLDADETLAKLQGAVLVSLGSGAKSDDSGEAPSP
jgi:hypothetical protein